MVCFYCISLVHQNERQRGRNGLYHATTWQEGSLWQASCPGCEGLTLNQISILLQDVLESAEYPPSSSYFENRLQELLEISINHQLKIEFCSSI